MSDSQGILKLGRYSLIEKFIIGNPKCFAHTIAGRAFIRLNVGS